MSMVLSGVPDPQSQLRSLQQELFNRNRQLQESEARVAELEGELAREKAKARQVERGAQQLRSVLTPLYRALGSVFGELDAMGVEENPADAPAQTAKSAVWDSWKQKLGGKVAQAIDVLALHGEMNAKQLRLHLQCGNDYVYQVVSKLNTNGLINKNGGKISLKQL